jgi:rod shape-determining protein MreD
MSVAVEAVKIGLAVLIAAILQVTIFASIDVAGGAPDLLLVTLVAVALLRGPIAGACAGFFGGLVADIATLETLGLTSLVLTVVGYWIGRYGETTGRTRHFCRSSS